MLDLRPDRALPGSVFGPGTCVADRTRAIGCPLKADAHHGIARDIPSRPPVDTGMPLGTVGPLRFPIQHKVM